MTIGSNKAVFSASESRRAHGAGSSYAKFARDNGGSLFTAVVPDESGLMGCGLTLKPAGAVAQISGRVFAVYLGRANSGAVINRVALAVSAAGTGTADAKVGIATSDAGPDFTAKTLTVRAVQNIDTVNGGTGRVSNTTLLNYTPGCGVHLWAVYVSGNGTTEPSTYSLTGDVGAGAVQLLAAQPTSGMVVGKVYAMSLVSPSVSTLQAPLLYAS